MSTGLTQELDPPPGLITNCGPMTYHGAAIILILAETVLMTMGPNHTVDSPDGTR